MAGRKVAVDLDETHTISLFGVQGGGKSYTLGSIIEMASLPAPPVNELPRPLATVVFHYSRTMDYAPEFTSMARPNDDQAQLQVLKERYIKQLAQERLNLAEDYIDDDARLTSLIRPGRLIIVDLRDEYIEKDEALGLFVVLMQLFSEVRSGDEHFNKLVVFDEAHKYIDSPDLVAGLVETVREMRHKGMSILVAS
ncbi:hypothetical protein ABZV34_25120 [Streptomyces sp. NPDC005195]|uniref:hypothetical protein n=1 Tax=Streptomyces sp. NPDC005195 TaxID=3154561 RepID=UPI0033A14BE5